MTESVVGPWAKDKLDRLEKYLQAYTTIMRKQSWCRKYIYVDAFAGPGEHAVRRGKPARDSLQEVLFDVALNSLADPGQRMFLEGSPRVALGLPYPFSSYMFIEKEPARVAQLNQLRAEYGDTRRITIGAGDCNEYLLEKIVRNREVDWRTWRFVVFLDPFGMQVPWETIAALGQTGAVEVFLNLPVGMAIQRLLLRSGKFTPSQRAKLDTYFGSDEWYDLLYREEHDLFGKSNPVKVEASGKALTQWYRQRLAQAFGHASKAALIRNTRGGHLYYLVLATPKATGLKIANAILAAGESV